MKNPSTHGIQGRRRKAQVNAHEIGAVTAALTACLYIKGENKTSRRAREGYIVIPLKDNWKRLEK